MDAGLVGAVAKEASRAGRYAAGVADGRARDASAAGWEIGRWVDRSAELRGSVTVEVFYRFAEPCFGSARYELLGASASRIGGGDSAGIDGCV